MYRFSEISFGRSLTVALVFSVLLAQDVSAQSEEPLPCYQWYTLRIVGRISNKWSAGFSRQYSRLSEQGAPIDYYLDDYRLSRKFGRRWTVFAGGAYLVSKPTSDKPVVKRRYAFGLDWRTKIFAHTRLGARITAERHLQERRYDGRVIGALNLDYSGLDIFRTVNIRPFINGQLYYFLGGNWIKQYESTGEVIRRSPTYGFHRLRLRLGLAVSPCSWLQLSAFYLIQNEFNTRHAQIYHHRINEINPSTGKVTRPFSDYRAWGAGVTFFIGVRKKDKKKQEIPNAETDQ